MAPITTARGEYVPRATRRAFPNALGEDEVIVEGSSGGDTEAVCVAVAVEDGEGHEVPGDLCRLVSILFVSFLKHGRRSPLRLRFLRARGPRWH